LTVDLNRSLDQSTQDFLPALPQGDSPRTGSLRYHKLRKLGEGGLGVVWLAENLELKRQVALKEPRPDRLQQAADIETYLAEASVLASLDHPHIVPVYDVGRTAEGSCYVVSKLIDGTALWLPTSNRNRFALLRPLVWLRKSRRPCNTLTIEVNLEDTQLLWNRKYCRRAKKPRCLSELPIRPRRDRTTILPACLQPWESCVSQKLCVPRLCLPGCVPLE
jgi:hypothetical protein